jgi:hypothetical protein
VKTISLKKVSAVAVASLGFGLLSVVPAQAAETAATTFSIMSSSASSVDAIAATTSTLTYASAGLTLTAGAGTPFASTDVGRYIWTDEYGQLGPIASVTSSTVVVLTAAPTASGSGTTTAMANTNSSASWWIGSKAATVVGDGITTSTIKGMTVTAAKKVALNLKFNAATNDAESKARIVIGGTVLNTSPLTAIGDQNKVLTFTAPVAAGTYEAVVQYAIAADFTAVTTVSKPFTLTVVADSEFSADVSTVYMNDDGTEININTTAATTALGATGVSTVDTLGAVIWFNAKKASGSSYSGGTFYAYMTGPGKLDIDGTTYVRSESIANTGQHYVKVAGDGTTGVGTVVMYMILADGVTKVNLPSRTVSFYGSVAKLEATVVQGIATAGAANGECGVALTECTYATLAEKPAVLIKATDANGVLVPGLTVAGKSADTTVVSSSAVAAATGANDYNGTGYYNASVTGGSITGKSASLTYSVTLSSGTVITSNAVSIANAGTPKTVTWALDKTAYEPGALVLITVTAKDAAGNPAADGTYANLFTGATTASGSITGSTPAASVELVGGKKEYKAFAPGTGGNYTITNTTSTSTGASAGTVLTGTVVVTNPNAGLLTQIDALNAKIVALNALIAKIMKKLGVK